MVGSCPTCSWTLAGRPASYQRCKRTNPPQQENHQQGERLQRALENLRKQHKWGDISDEEYRSERNVLVRQLKLLDDAVKPRQLPNLERAAEFLQDLPRLWLHPGVTHEEREALVKQVFQRITIDGKDFVDIEPKPEYAPLFATMVTGQKVGYQELDSNRTARTKVTPRWAHQWLA